MDQVLQGLLDEIGEGHVVGGMVGKRRLRPFHDADDVIGNCVEGPGDDGHAGSGLDPFRHLFRRIFREGQKQDFLRLTDARLDEVGRLGGDHTRLARSRPRKDERRILIDDNRKALFRRQRLALDGVEEFLPSVQFCGDEGGDAICPCSSWVARELPDGRDARDDLGTDGIGIQLRQERCIQSTGGIQQGRNLTRGGVSGRYRE